MIGKISSVYIARLETILSEYAKPYDPKRPVLCFDERPCFLIGDKIAPIVMKSGQVAKEHYAYEKNGSSVILAAIEPLTGRRFAHVEHQRRKIEYAHFMQELEAIYPEAEEIIVVQDNLNTHNESSFYENFHMKEALRLSQRFNMIYTPKSASWLNMIEIEFSAISRACLNRRIPTYEELKQEVMAVVKDRDAKRIKIDWQFSIESARDKLNRHYAKVNPVNRKTIEI